MSAIGSASVRRVAAALAAAGLPDAIVQLSATARSADDAARAVGCERGAIVKSLVFMVGDRPAMALVAGDRRCDPAVLARVLGGGEARRATADEVRSAPGFAIGGVAPLGLAQQLPCVMDGSLWRFQQVWAAAGHPHCVFATDPDRLRGLTAAIRADDLAAG